jgi:hypothetical protein
MILSGAATLTTSICTVYQQGVSAFGVRAGPVQDGQAQPADPERFGLGEVLAGACDPQVVEASRGASGGGAAEPVLGGLAGSLATTWPAASSRAGDAVTGSSRRWACGPIAARPAGRFAGLRGRVTVAEDGAVRAGGRRRCKRRDRRRRPAGEPARRNRHAEADARVHRAGIPGARGQWCSQGAAFLPPQTRSRRAGQRASPAAWGAEPASGVVSRYLNSATRSVNFQPSLVRW